LRYLNLAINHVLTVPNEICLLSNLKYLNLQGDFFVNYTLKIKDLPADLGNLTNLESLILSDNVIENLPESLGNCTKLETLDVKDNLLSTLPTSFGNLQNLKNLNVKANEITQFPANFSNLLKLENLDLSFNFNINGDQTAAYLAKLKNLQTLNISDCYFSDTAVNLLLEALPSTNITTFTPRKEKKD
jgi:hypothetical protein